MLSIYNYNDNGDDDKRAIESPAWAECQSVILTVTCTQFIFSVSLTFYILVSILRPYNNSQKGKYRGKLQNILVEFFTS